MDIPSKVYIDPRVARTLSPEPDPEKLDRNIKEACYISLERATELVRDAQEKAQASIPQEYVVQLVAITPPREGAGNLVIALTNLGRLYERINGDWFQTSGPELGP